MPWDLDQALLRRLEKRVIVQLPNKDSRLTMIKNFLPLTKEEISKINDYSEGYFEAFNDLRIEPEFFLSLAKEFNISELFTDVTELPPSETNMDYYDLCKEKIIEFGNQKKTKDDFIRELQNREELQGTKVEVYFGRQLLIPRPSRNEDWLDYCRRGVCDIFSRYSEENINLLTKQAECVIFVCIVDDYKSVVYSAMILFNSY